MEQREQRGRRDGAPQQENEFDERLVFINRCSKVVKGGRRFSFSAVVVVDELDVDVLVGHGDGHAGACGRALHLLAEALVAQAALINAVLHSALKLLSGGARPSSCPACGG